MFVLASHLSPSGTQPSDEAHTYGLTNLRDLSCALAHSVHHITVRSPLNKGADGCAFGLINAFNDHLELRGPALADLVPVVEDGDDISDLPAVTIVQSGARNGDTATEQAMRFEIVCAAPNL